MARPTIKSFDDVISEVFGANQRAGAIVGVAFIENYLRDAIAAKLRPLTAATDGVIFEGQAAPLNTMHAKIHMAYAMGIVSDVVRDDLLALKDIRNKFAHELEVRTFDHPEVVTLCGKLNAHVQASTERNEPIATDAAIQFTASVGFLLLRLMPHVDNKLFRPVLADMLFSEEPIRYPRHVPAPPTSQKKVRVRPSKGSAGSDRRNPE